MTQPDPRTHAFRPDLADAALEGRVEAERYVEGERYQVAAGHLPLRTAPAANARLGSELLFGEVVTVFEIRDGWAWLRNETDDYVGYAPAEALSPTVHPATHAVGVLRTYLFPEPDIKSPPTDLLSMNAAVAVARTEGGLSGLAGGGWVWSAHLCPLGEFDSDPGAVARKFMGAPYLWGGRTSLGLDCSGLVQMALARCGIAAPRDTDMQQAALGQPLDYDGDQSVLRRNDLVFWPGHVGFWLDARTFLHANATDMMVAAAPFDAVIRHVRKATGHAVSAVRRL